MACGPLQDGYQLVIRDRISSFVDVINVGLAALFFKAESWSFDLGRTVPTLARASQKL